MLIYRFRITSTEHDDFSMEIEIQPNQNFRDFHECIVNSAELLPAEKAFFFPTDKNYKKGIELSLKSYKKQVKRFDPELDETVVDTFTPKLMKDAGIKNYIEDPHQRLVYEYHGKITHVLLIELYKIVQSEGTCLYPQCIRKQGELPKQVVKPVIPEPRIAPEAPAPPKTVAAPPREPVPALDEIDVDEAELAEIDNEIGSLLEEEAPVEMEGGEEEKSAHDEAGMESSFYEEEEGGDEMVSLDEFENLDNLDINYSGYDKNQDD